MEHQMYPGASKDLAPKRRKLAPERYGAFRAFAERVTVFWNAGRR